MRNLIVCCDGTWNTAEQESVTNVRRLYNALEDIDDSGNAQLRYYQPGVGNTDGLLNRLLGGSFGVGLSRDVMTAYQWLTVTYQPGDRILLFGFSRGAYTVRSLAGMIAACGLIDTTGLDYRATWRVIRRVYEGKYRRRRNPDPLWRNRLTFSFDPGDASKIPVWFIGVWDTVGSLGIPDHIAILNQLDPRWRFTFHDVRLNPHVRHARHAVALDEWRGTFIPTLWEEPAPKQDFKQVWFPGSHMDVGGGHRETGLSDGALEWMIDEARSTMKIAFYKATEHQIRPDPLDRMHDDDRGLLAPALAPVFEPLLEPVVSALFEPRPRAVPLIDAHTTPPSPAIDKSVYNRQQSPPITAGPYRPTHVLAVGESVTVDVSANKPWNETGLYLEAGAYRFTADGVWLDGGISSGPAGTTGARRFNPLIERGRLVSTLLGQGEKLVRWISRNPEANFFFTRREEDLPWMSLVGVIANNATRLKNGSDTNERIAIGIDTDHRVTKGGYLYAYANDAWGFYGNNQGSVRLTVTRNQ